MQRISRSVYGSSLQGRRDGHQSWMLAHLPRLMIRPPAAHVSPLTRANLSHWLAAAHVIRWTRAITLLTLATREENKSLSASSQVASIDDFLLAF
ncbi:hypothetical protein E2C01_035222 [Portunus trituberculatus]|uniref:Uncharacterized protein n=1 Tax=Portunus trituberculatus TaxID=210409 RepID=A0A5B7F3N1_PORTR|nr:hypothetical protein [Portunus trituberculatus]